ncbi:hypothetical protein OG735_17505 [Streptomyces sp. NBC_01210]|uniref:hypothetical protein n=1 Tax=Streptomyces sp. NBC_01210 TaxID=2903774 RepID=UPI002E137476|nr:hypothetical protein OG735_17505 [Streptomyces sp. NBC_01210]
MHGDRDTVVPVDIARRFAADLRDASVATVVYVELPGRPVRLRPLPLAARFEAVVDGVEAFADWVISREWVPW